ncbi:MAG: small ribosomal subunit protein uS17 [Minisyncoccia bacterium]
MEAKQKKQKRLLKGIVTSDKMEKTVVVTVKKLKSNSKYQKAYWVNKKFKAHNEKPNVHVGDEVTIEATKPFSKDVKWKVI